MSKEYSKVIYHLLNRYSAQNLVKYIFEKLGYKITGYHHIYLKKSQPPSVVEFIGLAGKTYLLKNIVKSSDLKRVKPIMNRDFDLNLIGDESKFIIKEIFDLNTELSYETRLSLFTKLMLSQNYKDYCQLWDEGFVKEGLSFILALTDKFPHLMVSLFRDFKFVIVSPPLDKVVNRYYNRDKPLITYAEYFDLNADSFLKKISYLESFIHFCSLNEIDHIVIQGEDQDVHAVKEFIFESKND
jgi:hypothetical protein